MSNDKSNNFIVDTLDAELVQSLSNFGEIYSVEFI